ncbi:hypothetical protein D3C79_870260 [compost metagenome]
MPLDGQAHIREVLMHVFHVHRCLNHEQVHDPVAQRRNRHGNFHRRAERFAGSGRFFRVLTGFGDAGIVGQANGNQQRHQRKANKRGIAQRK